MANVTPTGKKRIRRSKVWKYMNEECSDSGRRTAICNWQHCGKKMSISYNGGTTNLIDHLVSTHGFNRTPLKPPREDASDSDSINSSNSKESEGRNWKDSKGGVDSDKELEFIRSDKDYEYFGPMNTPLLPEPYVSYTSIKELHTTVFYRAFSKVEMKGSDKWFILCLASQKLSQSSPKIKTEKEMKEAVAFIMNADTKDIQKESLAKLKYLKGNISADLKREAHNAIDHLSEWINKNDNGKKRPREAGLNASQVLVKKELTPEDNSGEEVEKKIHERFTSPERKRQKKPGGGLDTSSNSHLNSPRSSPNEITTAPIITPTPPLTSTSANNNSRSKMSPQPQAKYTIPLLTKKRTVTIAKPEPPQPLDDPKMF